MRVPSFKLIASAYRIVYGKSKHDYISLENACKEVLELYLKKNTFYTKVGAKLNDHIMQCFYKNKLYKNIEAEKITMSHISSKHFTKE